MFANRQTAQIEASFICLRNIQFTWKHTAICIISLGTVPIAVAQEKKTLFRLSYHPPFFENTDRDQVIQGTEKISNQTN